MDRKERSIDAVHFYMSELSSRVVAQSQIPSDRYHLGKLILQSFKDAPNFINQIDGGIDKSETNASVLERSVRCAVSMRKTGLKQGDVIVLMAPNHNDLAIPIYAALYLGIIIAPIDMTLTVSELQHMFAIEKPKMIFCQSKKAPDVQLAVESLELKTDIVTFDKGDKYISFAEYLEKYGADSSVDDFRPSDFNTDEAIAFLICTSGTTGMPKAVASTYKNFAAPGPYLWTNYTKFPTPTRMALVASPLQWLTAVYHFLFSPIFGYTRLQTSLPLTQEHAYYLVNTYKPTFMILTPTFFTTLIKPGDRDSCDFTCFEHILLGGSAVSSEIAKEMKMISPKTKVDNLYGMSELSAMGTSGGNAARGSSGKPLGCYQYRIVNIDTLEDIDEPNVPGELWIKGPGVFKGYYNNPEATEKVFAEDGWFRTGDIFYIDENWNFFFVDRFKSLLKYKNHQISPVEIENVIRKHPGVLDVAVTGIPELESGDLAVACVVPRPDWEPNAQQIKDLVRDNLTDSKQLRGGVIFMSSLPMNKSTKIDRRRLKEMVLSMKRE